MNSLVNTGNIGRSEAGYVSRPQPHMVMARYVMENVGGLQVVMVVAIQQMNFCCDSLSATSCTYGCARKTNESILS